MLAPKKYLFIFFLFFLIDFISAQTVNKLPNDCVNAITVCGGGIFTSNANGSGIQEINTTNSCNSEEHNSVWLKISIIQAGTLGFTLTPSSSKLEVDYDFFVYGPSATCGNIGQAIRCSTTNPLAAGQTSNSTGMNGSESDASEGPGESGNGFVKWLNVAVGDSYFIVIDRPIGDGGFDLQWTGSATTGKSPFPPAPTANKILNKKECTIDGKFDFDLNTYKNQINSDSNNTVDFFASLNDASDNINPIPNTQNISEEEKTIYSRVTNPNGCFDITDFKISAYKEPIFNNTTLVQCDLDNNSTDKTTSFNLTQAEAQGINNNPDYSMFYYKSIADRNSGGSIINPENFTAKDGETIYVKVINKNGCEAEGEIKLKVNPTLAGLDKIGPFYVCANNESSITPEGTFDLKYIKDTHFKNLDIALYNSLNDASLELNKITSDQITTASKTIYARIEKNNECQDVKQFDLVVNKKPIVNLPNPLPLICLNDPEAFITAESGFDEYKWVKIDDTGNETTVGTSRNVTITSPGNYKLILKNIYSDAAGVIQNECSNFKTFTINTSNIATFTPDPEVEDIYENNRVTVFVEGEGDYLYAIEDIVGPYQTSNVFENVPKGFATIYVRDKNGCGTVSKTISIIGYDKFFTPNNDNHNDYWRISGINSSTQSGSYVFIFDKYGKLVKQLNPLSRGWDGTFNGIPLPASDYWFRVKLEDGRDFKGHFTLKR